ncbi:MAG: hypothetical protein Q9192_001572 [Flavoplaca navasiana]
MDNESYYEMLYRLCRRNLPPEYTGSLTSPTAQAPTLCIYPSCPVHGTHAQGLYVYNGVPNNWQLEEYDFGASNPPPAIWFARHRIIHEVGSREDYHLVHGFIHYHYVPKDLPQQERYSPSVTSSAHDEPNMMDLTDDVAALDIDASNAGNGGEVMPTDQDTNNRTEAEEDAEIEQQLCDAYYEMELEDAEERAAQMNISDETAEASTATQALDGREEAHGEPANVDLQDLVETAYMTCITGADPPLEHGDHGIL